LTNLLPADSVFLEYSGFGLTEVAIPEEIHNNIV